MHGTEGRRIWQFGNGGLQPLTSNIVSKAVGIRLVMLNKHFLGDNPSNFLSFISICFISHDLIFFNFTFLSQLSGSFSNILCYLWLKSSRCSYFYIIKLIFEVQILTCFWVIGQITLAKSRDL